MNPPRITWKEGHAMALIRLLCSGRYSLRLPERHSGQRGKGKPKPTSSSPRPFRSFGACSTPCSAPCDPTKTTASIGRGGADDERLRPRRPLPKQLKDRRAVAIHADERELIYRAHRRRLDQDVTLQRPHRGSYGLRGEPRKHPAPPTLLARLPDHSLNSTSDDPVTPARSFL